MTVYKVTAAGELYTTERWVNTWHVESSAINEAATLDAFENFYSQPATGGGIAALNPCCGNAFGGTVIGVHLSSLSLQALLVPPPVATVRAVSHNGGQNTPGGLPVDVALCLSLTTGLAGRSFRGRVYLPPWHENKNDDSGGTFPSPDSATITGILINAKKLCDDLVTAASPLVVWSRTRSLATTVTGGYIDTNWDTQRRRSKSQPAVRASFVV